MATWAVIFLAACAQSALGSYYHGPTAVPHVLKSGYLADTHEVAAAKGAHLAALSSQSYYGHGGDDSGAYSHGGDYSGAYNHGGDYSGAYSHGGDYSGAYNHGGDYAQSYGHGYTPKYQGPIAVPHVLKSGYLADTHEVAAAKSAHLLALSKQSHYGHGGDYNGYSSGGYGHGGDYNGYSSGSYGHGSDYNGAYSYGGNFGHGHDIKYHGPTAIPHVLKNGHIADTHEVAAAKAAHYVAVSKANAHGGYGYASNYGYAGDYGYGSSYGYDQAGHAGSYGGAYGHGHDLRYHGPIAIPHVLKNGHIADTHEVAVAKAHHYAAVAEAKSHGGYGYGNGYSHGYSGHY